MLAAPKMVYLSDKLNYGFYVRVWPSRIFARPRATRVKRVLREITWEEVRLRLSRAPPVVFRRCLPVASQRVNT